MFPWKFFVPAQRGLDPTLAFCKLDAAFSSLFLFHSLQSIESNCYLMNNFPPGSSKGLEAWLEAQFPAFQIQVVPRAPLSGTLDCHRKFFILHFLHTYISNLRAYCFPCVCFFAPIRCRR